MTLSHDDQIRQLTAGEITGTKSEPVIRVTRTMVNRAQAVRPEHLAWRVRSQGGMKSFLAMSRTIQRLPSIGKGRRE